MLKVGLIGFGLAGQSFHGPSLRTTPGVQLACILERSGSTAQQKYPDVRVVRTLDELLADAQIQLCVVATPNQSHFDLAKRCLEAGRHVVVDKPFAPTLAEAEELVRLAEQHGRLLTVYHSRRFDGDFQTVIKLVDSGVLGELSEYEVRYDRFRPTPKPNVWRERDEPGSGVMFDLAPHLIDQPMLLFGEPLSVTATAFRQRPGIVVDDAFDISLEYPRHRAMLRARMLAYAPGPHFVIHGSKGSFIKYGMDPQEEFLRRGEEPHGDDWGLEAESQWGTLSLADGSATRKIPTKRGDYRRFYAGMRDAILEGAELPVTTKQSLASMRVLSLAQQSSKERRTIPW
ncbi:MAG TPA: oxidoreductase [Terriglobales bacterium]|jgi:predicted dehydrogenase|nr:oxidoreductase [Terriglobales bacterium]